MTVELATPSIQASHGMPSSSVLPIKITLLQASKLIVGCAVAFGCIAPLLRLWQAGAVAGGTMEGLWMVAIFEGVLVPLVWVALVQILVRRGPWRDGLVRVLVLNSVLVALGFAGFLLVRFTIPEWLRGSNVAGNASNLWTLGSHLGIIAVLMLATLFLARRLWQSWIDRTATI